MLERRRILAAFVRRLVKLPPDEQRAKLALLSPAELLIVDALFEAWAHDGQLPPSQDGWRTWLMMAGRGFGKTRAGAEWIYELARSRPVRIALVGATIDEARRVMVEGASGLLSVARRWRHRVKWEPSKGELTWPRGSGGARCFRATIRTGCGGRSIDFAWCDELAKWRQPTATWDNLQLGLRHRAAAAGAGDDDAAADGAAEADRSAAVDGHDRRADGRQCATCRASSIDVMTATYGGTRLGRQELDGELIAEIEGALWPQRADRAVPGAPRLRSGRTELRASRGRGRSAGGGRRGRRRVRDRGCGAVRASGCSCSSDASVQGLSPEGWANRVAAAAARWGADLVVAEANNGGAMVESVLKAADSGLQVQAGPCRAGARRRGPSRWRCGSRRGGRSWPGAFPSWRTSLRDWWRAAVMRGRVARPTAPTRWSGR